MARSIVTFTGRNGQGLITGVTGLKAGDQLLIAANQTGVNQISFFCGFCQNDEEVIQTSPGDNTGNTYTILIERHSIF